MQNPERVRYVAANYEQLQGLSRVLVGVLIAVAWMIGVSPLGDYLASPRAADFITAGSFLAVLVGGAVYLLVRSWYQRRYGRVRMVNQNSVRRYLIRLAVMFVTLVIATAVGSYIGALQNESWAYLFFIVGGAGAITDWWPDRRFRWYYVVFGLLMILTGLLLMFGVLPDRATLNLLAGFVVLYLIVGGLLDHLLLVRTLKSVPEE